MHYDVLLIQPPFGSIDMPSLGLSTINAVLKANQISSKVIYSNMIYTRLLDQKFPGLYHRLGLVQSTSLAGEWVFASKAFNSDNLMNKEYLQGYYETGVVVPMLGDIVEISEIEMAKTKVDPFIKQIIELIVSYNPKIVGFSSLFQQTCSSIAIAQKIKEKIPKVITVLGGSNFLDPMSIAITEVTTDIIDYIFEGEAEFEFLEFCQRIIENKEAFDSNKRVIKCQPVMNLDSLPIPDYNDYFEQLEEYKIKLEAIKLPFESSRGCWWGERVNCLFCGLNGMTIQYRRKSNARIIEEIEHLTQKYDVQYLQATDNIMPQDLPASLYSNYKPPARLKTIYYEVKPTLNFDQLSYLEKSAVNSLQPGLESLNDHLLKLLRKGITGTNNIRFLRDCKTLGIRTDWNLLYAIPGETVDDYYDIMRIIPKISHLRPPDYIGPINIQRFSPLFNEPEKYGIKNIRPVKSYSYVFPKETNLNDLALYFDGEFDTIFKGELKKKFYNEVEMWRNKWKSGEPPTLQMIKLTKDFYLVEDSRSGEAKVRVLTRFYYSVLTRLREPKMIDKVKDNLEKEGLNNYYNKLLEWDFIVEIGRRVVSLVCEPLRALYNNKKDHNNGHS
ncbi:MAG: RiPP maturation radical SAM C-methyltransferase [Candidatus Hodarchaeales archaeon]